LSRERPIKLELSIGEAYHIAQALEAYIKSGVYGASLPSWREIHHKVQSALQSAALKEKFGGGGYRGNPQATEHLRRAGPRLTKARKEVARAVAAYKDGKPVKAAGTAAKAYSQAVLVMDDLHDGSSRPLPHLAEAYQMAVQVSREAMDIITKVGRNAQSWIKRTQTKKKEKGSSRTSTKARSAKANPGDAARRLRNRISRL